MNGLSIFAKIFFTSGLLAIVSVLGVDIFPETGKRFDACAIFAISTVVLFIIFIVSGVAMIWSL